MSNGTARKKEHAISYIERGISFFNIVVDASSLQLVEVFEDLEVLHFVFPPNPDINSIPTIGELVNVGGHKTAKAGLSTAPNLEDPKTIYLLYANLSPIDKETFQAKLRN